MVFTTSGVERWYSLQNRQRYTSWYSPSRSASSLTYGYLGITSPEPGCGKSLVMEVMELFCASPDYTVNSSGPALFRTIHKDSPTLLIDEAEKLSPDLRAIINTGYRRRAAVPRCLGPEVVRFRTYCPKVLASLNMLSPALLDRVILIQMRKALPDEGLTRFDFESAQQQVADLHADIEAWAEANRDRVALHAKGEPPDFLRNRAVDIWFPLFVVCELAASHRLNDLTETAKRLIALKVENTPELLGNRLLADISWIFLRSEQTQMHSAAILQELTAMVESPWPAQRLNQNTLAAMLRPYGIHSQSIRIGSCTNKGYKLSSFADAFARYLLGPTATVQQLRHTSAGT
jgi:Protein of unknown function (DUF3631)